MKIGGKKIHHGPKTEIIVFDRGDDEPLAFRATAMLDRTDFDKYYPAPKMRKMRGRGSQLVDNPDDPRYKTDVERYNKAYMDFMFISSLSAVNPKKGEPDLPIEWEKVKIGDKNTWHHYEEELKESGLGEMERKRLFNTVMSVNCLNDSNLEEARSSFLKRQEEELLESSSSMDDPNDTQSGELANDSESDHQESQTVGTDSMSQ